MTFHTGFEELFFELIALAVANAFVNFARNESISDRFRAPRTRRRCLPELHQVTKFGGNLHEILAFIIYLRNQITEEKR